jgi:hypothetical protein
MENWPDKDRRVKVTDEIPAGPINTAMTSQLLKMPGLNLQTQT